MKFRLFTAAIILALSLPAAAQFRQISKAHEVDLASLRLPQTATGTIGFKPCNTCEFTTKRVTAETMWVLNGRTVKFEKFRDGLATVTERKDRVVTVLQHLESGRIKRVSFTIR